VLKLFYFFSLLEEFFLLGDEGLFEKMEFVKEYFVRRHIVIKTYVNMKCLRKDIVFFPSSLKVFEGDVS
jgi:hypothetical protein